MKNIQELSTTELLEINGGHDGLAYEIGQCVGKSFLIAGVLIAIFSPKS